MVFRLGSDGSAESPSTACSYGVVPRQRKKAVSVRLDERVLVWLKSKGGGHLTLINDILANLMEAELKATRDH